MPPAHQIPRGRGVSWNRRGRVTAARLRLELPERVLRRRRSRLRQPLLRSLLMGSRSVLTGLTPPDGSNAALTVIQLNLFRTNEKTEQWWYHRM